MSGADFVQAYLEKLKKEDPELGYSITKKATKEMIDYVFDTIIEQVAKGESIMISGFGTFYCTEMKEKITNTSITGGKDVVTPAHRKPSFKSSPVFREKVQ